MRTPRNAKWVSSSILLLGISKRGDTYLRTLLIHGARSAILAAQRKADKVDDSWLGKLLQRRNHNVAAVALANKNLISPQAQPLE